MLTNRATTSPVILSGAPLASVDHVERSMDLDVPVLPSAELAERSESVSQILAALVEDRIEERQTELPIEHAHG